MKEALKLALELKNSASAYWTEKEILIIEKLIDALAQPGQSATDIAALIQGMEVSIDVSTGDHDAGHRLFGTVTLVQENQGGKHGLILLVQDPEPNFKAQPEQEHVYQIKVYGSQTAWHDAGLSAYEVTPEKDRRIVYTTLPKRTEQEPKRKWPFRYKWVTSLGYVVWRDVFEGAMKCSLSEAVIAHKQAVFVFEEDAKNFCDYQNATTAPPKRPWVGLTAQQAADCWTTSATKTWHNFEAALQEKNT